MSNILKIIKYSRALINESLASVSSPPRILKRYLNRGCVIALQEPTYIMGGQYSYIDAVILIRNSINDLADLKDTKERLLMISGAIDSVVNHRTNRYMEVYMAEFVDYWYPTDGALLVIQKLIRKELDSLGDQV